MTRTQSTRNSKYPYVFLTREGLEVARVYCKTNQSALKKAGELAQEQKVDVYCFRAIGVAWATNGK